MVDVENRHLLALLDDRDDESVRGINSNSDVVILLDHVLLDIASFISLRVDVDVHQWVFSESERHSLDEEGKHGETLVSGLELLSKSDHVGGIVVILVNEEGD